MALQGRCSRYIMAPITRGIINLWMKCKGIPDRLFPFDQARLNKSAQFLLPFGELKTVIAPDGTLIKWALYSPEKFNAWIEANGGIREGEWIRPKKPENWQKLQQLRQFKRFEEIGHAFRIPHPIANAPSRCILRCQGFGRTIPMDKAFIGLHLAAGFHYAIFDWRPQISIKGFFQDAETIYQALLQHGFSPPQIKPVGTCRTTFVIARLKELHHKEGLDVVMMRAPASLSSTIAHTQWPANRIGMWGLSAIEKDGADFNTLRRFLTLPKAPSRICLITNEGDQTIPPDDAKTLINTARKIGPCFEITKLKQSNGDPHFDEPLYDPEVIKKYFKFLAL